MARDAELRARITAQDDASKVIDKVATAAGDLEKPVEIPVEADVSMVLGALDEVAAQVKATADTADVLARALGPELAAKADPVAVVGNLKEMGLTLDQIKGNADELGAKMRELSDIDVGGKLGSSLGTARGKLDEVAGSAESLKSVQANLVGNALQDVGALGGIAGSTAVAVGQLGEYMTDAKLKGEGLGSVLKSFAGVAGPLAAIAAATQLVSETMGARAASAEIAAKSTALLTEAYKDGGNAAKNYATALNEAGKVEVALDRNKTAEEVGGLVGMFSKLSPLVTQGAEALGLFGKATADLGPMFEKAGVSTEDWAKAVVGGNQAFGDFANALAHTTLSAEDQKTILGELTDAQTANGEAKRNAAAFESVYGAAMQETSAHVQALNQAYAAAKTDSFAASQDLAADALGRVNALLTEQADALNAQVDAATAAADSQLAANDALVQWNTTLGDATASTDDLVGAAVNLSKASAQLADDQAAAAGATATATGHLDAQNGALMSTAAAASGPARDGILDYIGTVNQIPPEKMTDIKAALARGDVEEAKRLLDEASATRNAAIIADANTAAAEGDLQRLTAARTVMINAKLNPNYGAALGPIGQFPHAAGGTVGPNEIGIAGEAGAEFVEYPGGRRALLTGPTVVPTGTRVTSVRHTRQILSRRRPRFYAGGTGGGIPPIKIMLDGRPVAALIGSTTAPAVRAAAMTIRAGRA